MALDQQTVAVIGGSTGIGAAVIELLDAESRRGFVGSHNADKLHSQLARLSDRATGGPKRDSVSFCPIRGTSDV